MIAGGLIGDEEGVKRVGLPSKPIALAKRASFTPKTHLADPCSAAFRRKLLKSSNEEEVSPTKGTLKMKLILNVSKDMGWVSSGLDL